MQTLWGWFPISHMIGDLGLDAWSPMWAASAEAWGPWGMHMMWGSWGIGMMLMMLVFWGALIVGLIVLIRWLITSGQSGRALDAAPYRESALGILQKRYARGELSKAEFEAMRQDLQERV